MPQQSHLSNYDPSAFHAGLAWAAARQQQRDLLARQAQEEAARKQQTQDEYDLQQRNEAAKLAIQYQHEADQIRQEAPIETRKRELGSKLENITAQFNWATGQEEGSGNPQDFKKYKDALNVLQDKINGVDLTKEVDWSQFNLPPTPDRLPGQEERDAAAQLNKSNALKDELLRGQINALGETARHHRVMEGISATRANNSGAKLNQWQKSQINGAKQALGAWNAINNPPAVLSGDKRKTYLAARQAEYEKYAPSLMYSIRDPAIATQMGLDPETSKTIADEAQKHGNFSTPGYLNQFVNTAVDNPDDDDLNAMSLYAKQPNPNGATTMEKRGIYSDNPVYQQWQKKAQAIHGFFQGNIPQSQPTAPTDDSANSGEDSE